MSRILVTGSADGLGRAAAESLLSAGHDVIVHARSPERAAGLDTLVGRGAHLVVGDFTDRVAVRRITAELNDAEPLDAVIHNAGVWSGTGYPASANVRVSARPRPGPTPTMIAVPRAMVVLSQENARQRGALLAGGRSVGLC
ncbi:SDR family NAD(P)-dependent oxidoreductase [Streptomyces sp. NPDC048521]|uniref:SDR family NAD(P)-dependent oxidoreductase n=1 Tax=Streptomyces sp. NPDC048521 TaxID=3365566 RepID=UPI00371E458E